MHAVQKPTAEKILVKGLQISEHMYVTMHNVINTIDDTWVVNHILVVKNTKYYNWEVVKSLQFIYSKNFCSVHVILIR